MMVLIGTHKILSAKSDKNTLCVMYPKEGSLCDSGGGDSGGDSGVGESGGGESREKESREEESREEESREEESREKESREKESRGNTRPGSLQCFAVLSSRHLSASPSL